MLNHVFLMGRLTRDPELRATAGGDAVCNFSVASNEGGRDKNGEKREKVTFVDCTCWKKLAEAVYEHKRKGHLVLVEGKLNLTEWLDKHTQQTRSKLTVTAYGVTFLESPKSQPAEPQAPDDAMSERW